MNATLVPPEAVYSLSSHVDTSYGVLTLESQGLFVYAASGYLRSTWRRGSWPEFTLIGAHALN